MKNIITLLAFFIICSSQAQPYKSLTCNLKILESDLLTQNYNRSRNINELLANSKTRIISTHKEIIKDMASFGFNKTLNRFSYSLGFNRENGYIEMKDMINGLVSKTSWLNGNQGQYLKTGKLSIVSTEITKISGNIFGFKNAFMAELECF